MKPNSTIPERTIESLKAASESEQITRARYLAYAVAATREGYGPVATLFRAAARAEQVHARNFADVLRRYGTSARKLEPEAEPGKTLPNLQAALEGETNEAEKLYPQAIELARSERCAEAISALRQTQAAEKSHVRLFSAMLENLGEQLGKVKSFYVCPLCGLTLDRVPDGECPVCEAPAAEFETLT